MAIIKRWKLNRTGIHRSKLADATAGPEGAYSLDSFEDEKNFAMNPPTPPEVPLCWTGEVVLLANGAVFGVLTNGAFRLGDSGVLDDEIDRLRRNLWDRHAICLHKLVPPALGLEVPLTVVLSVPVLIPLAVSPVDPIESS